MSALNLWLFVQFPNLEPRAPDPIGTVMMGLSRKIRCAISALTIASLLTGPALAEPLTLNQALVLGIGRSPEVGQAQARVGAAEAVKDQVQREWFPTVVLDASIGARHLENDARVNLGLSSLDERPRYATISINQPVWDFGRRTNQTRAQKAKLASAGREEQVAGEATAYVIARTYLQVLVQQRIVSASEENVAFHTALTADVSEGVERGAMSISERQQAQERLQGAKITLAQANDDLASAKAELALLVGVDDVEVSSPPDPAGSMPATVNEAMAVAEANDPRLLAMKDQLDAASWAEKRVRAERFPTFGLQGRLSEGKDFEGYRGTTRDYQILLSMRWNLFDGGVTAARIRESDHQTDEALFALAQARRESELQVRKSWIGIQSWRSKLESQQARLKLASEVRETYRAQFGIGRRSLLDLLDAQNAVYSASVETEVARAGTLLAQYALLAQLGRLRAFFGIDKTTVDPRMYGPR